MKSTLFFILSILLLSCSKQANFDLAIKNATMFDSKKGIVLQGKTILINKDTIANIIDASQDFNASKIIDAEGKLVTPGFIDTHIHLGDVIGNYEKAPDVLHEDSVKIYRQRLSETYLQYGVTVIKDVGHPESWLPVSLKWQYNSSPGFPDLFLCGSALISDEERSPYNAHVEIKSAQDAINKVNEYHESGIKYLKLYWRLRETEMKAVIEEGNKKKMNICAHIDNGVMTIEKALSMGVRVFEHCHTITNSAYQYDLEDTLWSIMQTQYKGINSYLPYELEVIQFVEDKTDLREKREQLINQMISQNASISSTIHLFGSICNRTYFNSYLTGKQGIDSPSLTDEQLKRLNKAFDTFMEYIKNAHDRGLKITIGTDCQDGGKALLSEMLLFYDAGLSLNSIFQIATINGAQSMNIDNKHGSIEMGKKANLVIFDKNPFDNPTHLLSNKMIIKDGIIYK